MDGDDEGLGCLFRAATVGLGMAIVGSLLVGVVPGGLWSDVPGVLIGLPGIAIELVCSALILSARVARWFGDGQRR